MKFTARAALMATGAALVLPAAAQARPLTAEDVAKLEYVGDVEISPDGSRVAYTTVSRPDVTEGEKDGGARTQLNLAWAPESARPFLPADQSVRGLRFSPDGRMISYLWREDGGETAVWAIPVDGGAPMKVAEVAKSGVRSYAWSPDGGTVYMLAGAEADKQRDAERKAGFDAIVYEEEDRLNRMFRASAATGYDAEVDAEPVAIEIPGYVSAFQVSNDGRTAVIESAPTPNVDDSYTSKRVHILDLASGRVTREVETPGKIGDVEMSPDGRRLSMIAGVDMNDPAATTLYFVDAASGAMTALNEGAPEAAVDAEFLPDGRLVAVIHKGVQSALRTYNADGSIAGEIDGGSLILGSVEEAGGTMVVTADSPMHPTELFSVANGQFTRWTSHNPWLSDITFGTQRAYTYTARDGQQIEGVLIEPVGGAPAGGAPLILNVHGGPEAHDSNGWVTAYSGPGQVAAGQGYAVFLPNYRGSTGYGTAFSKQHQGNYTDPEFTDIVDAKRALVADGIADPDRTGITGGSYGGYASAWAATAQSEEFAASVMFVGISNQISKFGTTDIPYEMYNVHSRAWPWDNWVKMLEVSPVYHVDKAETPILIMHGEEDTRVSPTQSYELYRSIKVRKPETPVRLVLYPGEGHGNQGAAARYDYNVRMMEWFDTYLKTGDRKAEMPAPRPNVGVGDEADED